MMRSRMTRDERKLQTRNELVTAARKVFGRRGFHGASLEEISAEAGYTTGAVYSSFGGKDELFLAVLDAEFARRMSRYADIALDAPDFETAGRALMAAEAATSREGRDWTPLLMEFWTHAAHRDDLRRALLERHHRQLDAWSSLMDELGERHGVRYELGSRELVRVVAALARGLGLERQIDPEAGLEDLYVRFVQALFLAFTERTAA
jgi:AcrR family transcriptional regulator